MSARVQKFIEANKISPVVYGQVLDLQRGGAIYRLENGLQFKLSRDECREAAKITGAMPRWRP